MLRAGTIRRVRQTLMATNLAQGALVAWQVPEEKLDAAFDYMFQQDPFSGHVVIRSTDAASAGSQLQTLDHAQSPAGLLDDEALRVPRAARPARAISASCPRRRLFALGVGHVRRSGMEPGSKADVLAEADRT